MSDAYGYGLGALRCEIRKHWAKRFHYDLRFEWNGILLDWFVLTEPGRRIGLPQDATEMEDHRLQNLMFEGVLDGNVIMVWDMGIWFPHLEDGDVRTSLRAGRLKFTLDCQKVHGVFTLERQGASSSRCPVWTFRKEAELVPAKIPSADVLANWPNSVLKGKRTMEQINRDWLGRRREYPGLFDQFLMAS